MGKPRLPEDVYPIVFTREDGTSIILYCYGITQRSNLILNVVGDDVPPDTIVLQAWNRHAIQ